MQINDNKKQTTTDLVLSVNQAQVRYIARYAPTIVTTFAHPFLTALLYDTTTQGMRVIPCDSTDKSAAKNEIEHNTHSPGHK